MCWVSVWLYASRWGDSFHAPCGLIKSVTQIQSMHNIRQISNSCSIVYMCEVGWNLSALGNNCKPGGNLSVLILNHGCSIDRSPNLDNCTLARSETSIQLKLKVVIGVCNYVIFSANAELARSFSRICVRNHQTFRNLVQNHPKFLCGIIKITFFVAFSTQK